MSVPDGTYDCIVVGGGLSGLCAAHRLRGRNILVLEASGRPGGRLHSLSRSPRWLNLGAHMFGGAGTLIGDLTTEMGLETRPIGGRLLGMAMDGRRLLRAPIEAYPALLPLSFSARLSFVRMGLALRWGAMQTVAALKPRPGETPAATRDRLFAFDGDRTLAQRIGPLHPEVERLLVAITERNGGDPSEMSAGHALRSFTNVWSAHSPGRNLLGGSSGLPRALALSLGDRIRHDCPVHTVETTENGVAVTWQENGETRRAEARACVLAVPAPVAKDIARDLPPATAAALGAVRYGPFLSVAVLTDENDRMPWDGNYAVSTPHRDFSVLFNQATTLPDRSRRGPGSSLMLFRGARGAARLMELSDREIEARFVADLVAEFPEIAGYIREVVVGRWPLGAPFGFPGRAALQPGLTAPLGPIVLAGDYLEFPNMEAAAQTGYEAAAKVLAHIEAPAGRA